ncbi:MAG: hypothetical protein WHT09_07470 [Thermogutta sp.]|jgi:hypothetical protein
MSFRCGITWACLLVTTTAYSGLSAADACVPAWHIMPGFRWAQYPLPACILDRGLLPYETNMAPYFAQFPVITVTPDTVQRWGRLVYRSDIARYGDQWTRQTWWNYRWIAQALAKGEILPTNYSSVPWPNMKKSDRLRQALRPILVINPFAGNHSNSGPDRTPPAVSSELGGDSKVTIRPGSSGPQPRRIINPFVAGQ